MPNFAGRIDGGIFEMGWGEVGQNGDHIMAKEQIELWLRHQRKAHRGLTRRDSKMNTQHTDTSSAWPDLFFSIFRGNPPEEQTAVISSRQSISSVMAILALNTFYGK